MREMAPPPISSLQTGGEPDRQSQEALQPKTAGRKWRVSRRGFLIGIGVAGAGLALGVTVGLPAARLKIAESVSEAGSFGNVSRDPYAWFEVLPDSRVRLFLTKAEMGQGVHTALAQIAAEELGIAVSDLEIRQATTNEGFADTAGTSGSFSVSSTFDPLREAAATLREMLHREAARTLKQPVDMIEQDGRSFIVKGDPAKRVAFGALVANKSNWQVPEERPALKPIGAYQIVGQSQPRVDVPDKVTGQAIYGYDVRVEGMLYGAVLRPPTLEATLKSVRVDRAESVDGVRQVVTDVRSGFAGVVAGSRAAARAGVEALEATWDEGKRWQQEEIDAIVTAGGSGGVTIQRVGDASGALRNPTLTAEYRSPFAIQTPLETQAALADVKTDRATIWVSTQSPFSVRRYVAQAVGLKEAQVEVHATYLGGGFGRKAGWEVAVEAARLSKAAGAPVHVGWTRQEELQNGYVRPPTHHRLSAKVQDGRITAMEHQQASGDVLFAFFPKVAADLLGADFGAYRGALLLYDIPNRHTITWRKPLPMRTGPWRGLGLLANVFAIETFMDELAHAAQVDPLEWRLRHLPDNVWGRRMQAVLKAAAEKGNWGKPAPEGRARGIACCTDADTVVAQVAEVSLDQQAGKIRVHEITLAMDCGLAINPDGIRAQAEGGVMWGVGSALIEEMRIRDGRVAARNFDAYPLLTMADAPHVEVILLDTARDGRPRGVGEPPMGPTAAAIGNAFFALTGKRLRQMPFTPERIQKLRIEN